VGAHNQIRAIGRAWLAVLLLLVLVGRGLAVPGYMVERSADGAAALVPCPSVQAPAHHGKTDPAGHSQSPCPFAALAAPALPPAPPAIALLPSVEAVPLLLPERRDSTPPPLAAPPPPATGPPVSA